MKIKTELGEFTLPEGGKHTSFSNDLYNTTEDRIFEASKLLNILELSNIVKALKAVKDNTGNLDNYLINIKESI